VHNHPSNKDLVMSALGSLLLSAMPQLLPLLQLPLLLLNGKSKSPSGPESSLLLLLSQLVLDLLGLPKSVPPVSYTIHHLRLQLLLRLLISKQLLSQLPHQTVSWVMFLLKLLPVPLTWFFRQFQVTSSANGALG